MPARLVEKQHGDDLISTDPARVDLDVVHRYLSNDSYWAAGRSFEVQRRAIQRQILATGDAHGLSSKFGYTPVPRPDRLMVRAAD